MFIFVVVSCFCLSIKKKEKRRLVNCLCVQHKHIIGSDTLIRPDIPMACECSMRDIAASRRSSSVLANLKAKHTQTWRYHKQARCSPLFGVRFIY